MSEVQPPEKVVSVRGLAAFALAALAAASVAARMLWEVASPLHFSTVKSEMYFRDVVTLGPAAAFALGAIALGPTAGGRILDRAGAKTMVVLATALATAAYAISRWGLGGIPHVADEAAYLWQAQVFLDGRLAGVTPPAPTATIIQYVADVAGERLTAFFPGSSVPLAVGYALGSPVVVNPVLAGLSAVITYWSGLRLFDDRRVAVIGAVLFAISPFTLFQAAGFFGHVWTAVLLVPAFTMALRPARSWEPFLVGALTSLVLFSRPVTAAVASATIGALWLFERRRIGLGDAAKAVAGAALPLVAFFAWNHRMTGDWLMTPHRLLLPNETVVAGLHALRNAGLNLAGLAVDFGGLPFVGLALVGLAVRRRNRVAMAVAGLAALQLAAYSLYYNHGISYGPRYLFELLPLLALVAAYGVTSSRWPAPRAVPILGAAALVALAGIVPGRLAVFHQRADYLDLAVVKERLGDTPTLVLVTAGPYRFPDPMYPAFVENGPRPGEGSLVFARAAEACEAYRAFPGQAVVVLNMEVKAGGAPLDQYLVRGLPPC